MSRTYSARERLFIYGTMWLAARKHETVDFKAVSDVVGAPRRTLRDWWSKPPPPGFTVESGGAVEGGELVDRTEAQAHAERVGGMTPAQLSRERLTVLYHQHKLASASDAAGPAANVAIQIARTLGEMLPRDGLMGQGPEHLTPEEYREWLRLQAERASDQDIELIMSVYANRTKGTIRLVGRGGNQSELQDDATWRRIETE